MTKGLRAVKQNRDINSTNPDDFLYTSETTSPKVYKRFDGTIGVDGSGSATLFLNHSLGYSPIFLLYTNPTISIVNGPVNGSFPMPGAWGLVDNEFVFGYSSPGYIRIDIQSAVANAKYKYICYVFADPT